MTRKARLEMRQNSTVLAAAISLALLLPGVTVQAQSTSASTLEEVVVTARKRAESLQETPIAVTAFSADELEAASVNNLMDLGAYAPNVSMATGQNGSGGANNGQIYIRGVGQSDFLFTTDPGVGVYIDGVYHPRTLGSVLDIMDLEQVEVLRGPQGTLFGKNTIGGALNITSAKPSGEREGNLEATFGKFDRADFRGSINFPINDQWAGRAALSYKSRDGYGERRDFFTGNKLDETGDEEQFGGRLALRWTPSDALTADFSFDYSHWDQGSVPEQLIQFDDAGEFGGVPTILWNALVGIPSGLPMSSAFVSGDPDVSFGTGPNVSDLEAWGIHGTFEWDVNWAVVKTILAYREMEAEFGRDGDGSPLPIVSTNNTQDQDQFSVELQLLGTAFDDRMDWVAGFFYFDEFGRDQNDVRLTSGLFDALESIPVQLSGAPCEPPFFAPGCPGNPINPALDLDFDIFNEIDIASRAVFGQLTYDLTDQLSFTGGVRYTHEEKEYFLEHRRINSNTFIVPATEVDEDWEEVSVLANLQYKWNDAVMTYVTYSEGFKSGGFNGRPTVGAEVEPYDPEFVESIEFGIKSQWLDDRLRANAAVFFYNYDDLQFSAVSSDPDTGTLLLVTDNVAKADVEGFELELQARPTPNLGINVAVGYTDFEISDVEPRAGVTVDTQIPRTPEWTASASVNYTLPWQEQGLFDIRFDWSYEDDSFADVVNTPSIARESYDIVNARLTWEPREDFWGGGWSFALFGTNLGDERFIVSGISALDSFGTAEGFFNRPREWGITARKRFR